jgi:Ca2+-binding RTX toxin-like protein
MNTVTFKGNYNGTVTAKDADTHYILDQGSSITVGNGVALDAGSDVAGRDISINGNITSTQGVGIVMGNGGDSTGTLEIAEKVSVSAGATAVKLLADNIDFHNAGIVNSTGSDGVDLDATNVALENDGSIYALTFGVNASNYLNTIVNHDTIQGGLGGVMLSGVSGELTNYSLVTSQTDAVVVTGSDAKVVNYMTITGGEDGIKVIQDGPDGSSHTIINTGTITGNQYAILGGEGSEHIRNMGKIEGDVVLGGGDDVIDNRGGTITGAVYGGAGDDVYEVSDESLQIVEDAKGGRDTMKSATSFTLADHVEIGILTGGNDAFIQGNRANNDLYGSADDNTLWGQKGHDALDGGKGNDMLSGGADRDYFIFKTGDGKDTITDFHTHGAQHDYINLADVKGFDSFDDLAHHLSENDGSTMLHLGHGQHIVLNHVSIDDLNAHDFIFDT